jgi:N6-L-threonylcarbamoyladenine synthase
VRPSVILGIETSCDETAASIVVDGRRVLSSIVSSQIDLHARFGGVVPEIAGRAHVGDIVPVIDSALVEAGFDRRGHGIDAVAATIGPGLVGSLLIGVSAAKSLALSWGVPFLGVNHLEAHLLSPFLEHGEVPLPLVTLLVSGGHTLIVLMTSPTEYRVLGSTIDDAAGEAYDKVARYLGLAYPGGPVLDRLASSPEGRTGAEVKFPRGLWKDGYDFSFSGLKTAVVKYVKAHPELSDADVAAAFQQSVVDVLTEKTLRAARDNNAASIALGGGVAANSALRSEMERAATAARMQVFLPPRAMCTDNAAMVAAAAWWRSMVDAPLSLRTGVTPSLRLTSVGTQ